MGPLSRIGRLGEALSVESHSKSEDADRKHAAVALYLAPDPDRLLIIRRADRIGDPWSGQLALPGGRMELADSDLWETARRETFEEVGFSPEPVVPPVRLPDLAPDRVLLPPILVTPWLVILDSEPKLRFNSEVAGAVWVSLAELAAPAARTSSSVEVGGFLREVEGYRLASGLLWGMTERIVTPVVQAWSTI